jgi:hypothetical protein
MKSDISVEQVAFFLFSVLVSCFVHKFQTISGERKSPKQGFGFVSLPTKNKKTNPTYQKQKDEKEKKSSM